MFETHDRTCSKIEKTWFLLVPWMGKTVKCMKKIQAVVQRCSVKKRILKNLAKFTGKQLCCSLSLTVKGVFM